MISDTHDWYVILDPSDQFVMMMDPFGVFVILDPSGRFMILDPVADLLTGTLMADIWFKPNWPLCDSGLQWSIRDFSH